VNTQDQKLNEDQLEYPIRRVSIPAVAEHAGLYSMTVTLRWTCPVCGGPRGAPFQTTSYDGSMRLACDGWINPCGHVDKYSEVREESFGRRP
jgi:hypothetical protein